MPKPDSKASERKKITGDTYLHWYESMLLMRRFEEKCAMLYTRQKFGGFCHLYIGQEAVLAGLVSAKGENDNIITAYRDHVHPIALGTHPRYVMAELFGKATGLSKGKGGSMHMFDLKKHFFGGHGIVGAQIAMGAGIAFAEKYRESGNVTFCFLGDGALRQGILHETFNMAMMWKLPVVFCIENNQYAMGTSVKRTSNVTELFQAGRAYDMPSFSVDGMSCEDVHRAVSDSADFTRNGNGPALLEMKTYRYKGHSMSDPARYRTKEEVDSYKAQDPIEKVLSVILREKYADDKWIENINGKVKEMVEESVLFAENSPYPETSELYEDVYAESSYPFIKD